MSPPSSTPTGEPYAALRCICTTCATPLMLAGAQAPVSGPCPRCGAWIDASQFQLLGAPRKSPGTEPVASRRRKSDNVIAGKGRVRADGFLDHEFNERREMFGTLRVLAVSLAVLAVILFITLYLRQWMAS